VDVIEQVDASSCQRHGCGSEETATEMVDFVSHGESSSGSKWLSAIRRWDIDVAVLFRHAAGVLFMEDAHRCARIPNRFG
jgi:hypothetical protein